MTTTTNKIIELRKRQRATRDTLKSSREEVDRLKKVILSLKADKKQLTKIIENNKKSVCFREECKFRERKNQ